MGGAKAVETVTLGEESGESVVVVDVLAGPVSRKENNEGMVREDVGDVSMMVITAVERRVDIEKCMIA